MIANILLIVLLVCWVILWIAAIGIAGSSYLMALREEEAPGTLAKVGGGIALIGLIIPCGPFQMLALVGLVISTVAGLTATTAADRRIATGIQAGVLGLVIGSIVLCCGFGLCANVLDPQDH